MLIADRMRNSLHVDGSATCHTVTIIHTRCNRSGGNKKTTKRIRRKQASKQGSKQAGRKQAKPDCGIWPTGMTQLGLPSLWRFHHERSLFRLHHRGGSDAWAWRVDKPEPTKKRLGEPSLTRQDGCAGSYEACTKSSVAARGIYGAALELHSSIARSSAGIEPDAAANTSAGTAPASALTAAATRVRSRAGASA